MAPESSEHFTAPHYTALKCIALRGPALYSTELHCSAIHYTALHYNDEVISNPKLKAKICNAHFASKSTIINSSDTGPLLEEVDTQTKVDKIYTSKYEVGPHIKEMKVSHQSPCGIPSAFLKILYARTGSHLTNPMAKLFKNIFKHGIWPTLWKTANITTIYKKEETQKRQENFFYQFLYFPP